MYLVSGTGTTFQETTVVLAQHNLRTDLHFRRAVYTPIKSIIASQQRFRVDSVVWQLCWFVGKSECS